MPHPLSSYRQSDGLPPPPEQATVSELANLLSGTKPKRRRRLPWLLVFLLLVASGGAAWWAATRLKPQSSQQSQFVVETQPIPLGDLEQTVNESGILQLQNQQTLNAPENLTVQAILVEPGDWVAAGQPILTVRNERFLRDLQARMQQQQVKMQQDALDQQFNQFQLAQKEQSLERLQAELAETEQLVEQGYVAPDDLIREQEQLKQAQLEVKQARITVQKAELNAAQNAQLWQSYEAQYRDQQLTMPFNALILAVYVNPGDGIQQGSELITFGNPDVMEVKLQLNALNAQAVAVDQPVRVQDQGPNPSTYTGRITWVAPAAVLPQSDQQQRGSLSETARVPARVTLDQRPQAWIPGSPVNVTIVTAQRQQVPVVPLATLKTTETTPSLWVRDAQGQVQQRQVELGLVNPQLAEIEAGLAPGDRLIVNLPETTVLTPGQWLPTASTATESTQATP